MEKGGKIMDTCPVCGTPYKDASAKYCSECGAKRGPNPNRKINRCTNKRCDNYDVELSPEEKYCSICGHITTFGQIIEDMT